MEIDSARVDFPLLINRSNVKFKRTQEIPAFAAIAATSACAAIAATSACAAIAATSSCAAALSTVLTFSFKQNPFDPPLLIFTVIS